VSTGCNRVSPNPLASAPHPNSLHAVPAKNEKPIENKSHLFCQQVLAKP